VQRGVDFRCATASEQRLDELAGTATHLNAFVLVEHDGPWGAAALRDSRLPDEVKAHLSQTRGVKVLLARRHLRAHREPGFEVFACFPARRLLLTRTIVDHSELTSLDLAAIGRGEVPGQDAGWSVVEGPLFGVCTHGRHDACCAERGRPVAAALTASHPDTTWEVSHVGGDRFAANVLALPHGLYYGRMEPGWASEVAELYEAGRVDIERLRGRASYPMQVQFAEIALRRHLEEDGVDALRLVRRQGLACTFRRGDTEWIVTVRRDTRGEARLTCGLERLNPLPLHEVVSIRRRPVRTDLR